MDPEAFFYLVSSYIFTPILLAWILFLIRVCEGSFDITVRGIIIVFLMILFSPGIFPIVGLFAIVATFKTIFEKWGDKVVFHFEDKKE